MRPRDGLTDDDDADFTEMRLHAVHHGTERHVNDSNLCHSPDPEPLPSKNQLIHHHQASNSDSRYGTQK